MALRSYLLVAAQALVLGACFPDTPGCIGLVHCTTDTECDSLLSTDSGASQCMNNSCQFKYVLPVVVDGGGGNDAMGADGASDASADGGNTDAALDANAADDASDASDAAAD